METYFAFIIVSIFLIILPGPDAALVTRNTVAQGQLGGLKTALGTSCALLVHTLAAVMGISAIIVKSAFLFSIFKYIGAIYLFYLGFKALWALKKKEVTLEENERSKKYSSSVFRQGFFTNLLNPKVAIFFLTFLPQFVNDEHHVFVQFLIMGLVYTMLTVLWFLLYIYLINYISVFMRKASTQNIIQAITGFVLVGFGIKLFFEKNH
jgi:RhtB (resistance to homoserine/threonine) family protein